MPWGEGCAKDFAPSARSADDNRAARASARSRSSEKRGAPCTRSRGCWKITTGRPPIVEEDEPRRVAENGQMMGLRHGVLTGVNRDELPDGGAHIFAEVIRQIRLLQPGCSIEVLIPDFQGNWDALQLVMDERPEILNHNTETVPRLYRRVRPQAKFPRSVELLRQAKAMVPDGITKTGIMVGLGEEWDEVLQVMDNLREADVDSVTKDLKADLDKAADAVRIESGFDPLKDVQADLNKALADVPPPELAKIPLAVEAAANAAPPESLDAAMDAAQPPVEAANAFEDLTLEPPTPDLHAEEAAQPPSHPGSHAEEAAQPPSRTMRDAAIPWRRDAAHRFSGRGLPYFTVSAAFFAKRSSKVLARSTLASFNSGSKRTSMS